MYLVNIRDGGSIISKRHRQYPHIYWKPLSENWAKQNRAPKTTCAFTRMEITWHRQNMWREKLQRLSRPWKVTRVFRVEWKRRTCWPYQISTRKVWRTGDWMRTGMCSVKHDPLTRVPGRFDRISHHVFSATVWHREKYMLFNGDSKTKFKEQSIMVVQKQQSHQWFGNLVTCEWWDFVWLNEGFGRYFQYFATAMVSRVVSISYLSPLWCGFLEDWGTRICNWRLTFQVKPDWRLNELFVVEQHQTALGFDQTPRHPINTIVKNPNDIQDILDDVTYNKAAAVLRMIKHTVSEENFRQPLKLYLKNFKYVFMCTIYNVFYSLIFNNFKRNLF